MTRSPRLDLLTIQLLSQIRLASVPGIPARVYGPAGRAAVRLAHDAYREVQAMSWREDLRRSVEASAPAHISTGPDTFRTANRFAPNWRG